jgi:hypothetical protein
MKYRKYFKKSFYVIFLMKTDIIITVKTKHNNLYRNEYYIKIKQTTLLLIITESDVTTAELIFLEKSFYIV